MELEKKFEMWIKETIQTLLKKIIFLAKKKKYFTRGYKKQIIKIKYLF